MSVDAQQTALEKLDSTELGNKKLDTKEIAFLKSQTSLTMDFKEASEKNLLTDIRETNKISFASSEKVRGLLNGFVKDP